MNERKNMHPQLPTKNGQHGRIQTQELESERRAFTISPPTIPRMSDAESLRVFSGAPTWKIVGSSRTNSSSLNFESCGEVQSFNQQSMGCIPVHSPKEIEIRRAGGGREQQHCCSPTVSPSALSQNYYFTPLRSTDFESAPPSTPHTLDKPLSSQRNQSPSNMLRPNSALSVDTLGSIDELVPSDDQPPADCVSSNRCVSKARRGTSTSVRRSLL